MCNRIVRYIRFIDRKTGDIDNMKGVSIIAELHHETKEMRFKFSMCNGDNFSKLDGLMVADTKSKVYSTDYDKELSIVENVISGLVKSVMPDDRVNSLRKFIFKNELDLTENVNTEKILQRWFSQCLV